MRHKTRTIIFGAFLAFFVAAGAYALMTAFGLAVDLPRLRIVKTGSLFLDVVPANADLLLNGVPQDPKRPLFGRGALLGRLTPGTYEVTLEAPGHHPWQKTMTIRAGEVAKAWGVFLWLDPLPRETVAEKIRRFWPTAEGLVTLGARGTLALGEVELRGNTVIAADPASSFLVTAEGNSRFIIDLKNPRAALNLSELFQSLKERELGLRGTVPITTVLLHPFTPTKFIIASARAVYALDVRKVSLQKLLEASTTAAISVNRNEVLVADRDGTLASANLVLGTVSREPAFPSSTVTRVASDRAGTTVFGLSEEGTLLLYRSATSTTKLGADVTDFSLSSDETRIAMRTRKGDVTVLLLADTDESGMQEAGTRIAVPAAAHAAALPLTWFPGSPRYFFQVSEEGVLEVYETDVKEPQNHFTLAEHVADYAVQGETLYVLHTDGTLEKINLLP
ncbi:MAG: PEGA domain-containing protein [Candidatus Jorgensenbacteria bacterium]